MAKIKISKNRHPNPADKISNNLAQTALRRVIRTVAETAKNISEIL